MEEDGDGGKKGRCIKYSKVGIWVKHVEKNSDLLIRLIPMHYRPSNSGNLHRREDISLTRLCSVGNTFNCVSWLTGYTLFVLSWHYISMHMCD